MKLLTPELQQRFDEVGDQAEKPDPLVIAKFFDPVGSAIWYATRYNPDNNQCYGYITVKGYNDWGYFSMKALQNIKRPLAMSIKRDLSFREKPM
ncbi:MAG TPA: hypothetical protein DIU20_12145, partial [Cryomorphaceae bacterium]|nr:hypothetical protein [Cryomorphaceae bacterium]